MHQRLLRVVDLLRRNSLEVVRSCVKNCECVCAFKLHRAQQVYHRFRGVPRSRSLLRAVRTRTFLLGASSLAIFNWDNERISERTLKQHYSDIEHVKQLTVETLTCRNCGKRLIVDMPAPEIKYCACDNQSYAVKGAPGGWVPFIERKDLLVWRRECNAKPGLFEYKLYGAYSEVSADIFLQVQIDPEYRMQWDKSAVKVEVVEVDPASQSHVLYWEMKWPKFFCNRDYVFNRRYIVDHKNKVIVVRSQVTDHPRLPETKGKFRVKEYCCTMVIKPYTHFEQPGVEFCMTYYDNPGLSLPTRVQTWVATSAMPDFLVRLRNASSQYAAVRQGTNRYGCKNGPPLFKVINDAVHVS